LRVVIIGNGVAGISAARHLRKLSDHEIIVVSEEAPYHFSRPAMMYVSMGHMTFNDIKPYEDWFWKKNRIELKQEAVTEIRSCLGTELPRYGGTEVPSYCIVLGSGETIEADIVIFATGSVPAWYNWPGQYLPGVQSYVHRSDLDVLEANIQGASTAVVVGGGLIGVEAAEVLHSRGKHVTMLVRESGFYSNVFPAEESDFITKHIASYGIELKTTTELDQIVKGETNGRVDHVITSNGERIKADIVVLATGVKPNISLARDSGVATDRGILVNDRFETSRANIYAIGDCAQFSHGIQQLWYSARSHGEHVAKVVIQGAGPYSRGLYFNSAKFFDLEWQIYGVVPQDSNLGTSLFWKDARSERCLRICHDKGSVIGVHGIGVRLRQEVWTNWIEAGTHIDNAVSQLSKGLFDPEFTRGVLI